MNHTQLINTTFSIKYIKPKYSKYIQNQKFIHDIIHILFNDLVLNLISFFLIKF